MELTKGMLRCFSIHDKEIASIKKCIKNQVTEMAIHGARTTKFTIFMDVASILWLWKPWKHGRSGVEKWNNHHNYYYTRSWLTDFLNDWVLNSSYVNGILCIWCIYIMDMFCGEYYDCVFLRALRITTIKIWIIIMMILFPKAGCL